jgi:hypothetical protein
MEGSRLKLELSVDAAWPYYGELKFPSRLRVIEQ